MAQVKDIHIIDPVENLIDRLQIINLAPSTILSIGVEGKLIKKLYPQAKLVKDERADLIVATIQFSENLDLMELLKGWRGLIKPSGLLLFGIVNIEYELQILGDLLIQLGFLNVVMDIEDNVIYGHAVSPQEVSVKINQIRRAS